jgi:hypothetical protein
MSSYRGHAATPNSAIRGSPRKGLHPAQIKPVRGPFPAA